jgi:hypothetical protein
MNEDKLNPDDANLRSLLRESRVTPPLPPRFRECVWRRIEGSEAGRSAGAVTWLEVVVARLLRPRFALVMVVVLVLAGTWLGVRDGAQAARQQAQARYLEKVAPNTLH